MILDAEKSKIPPDQELNTRSVALPQRMATGFSVPEPSGIEPQ
jgi:hypothetical protein